MAYRPIKGNYSTPRAHRPPRQIRVDIVVFPSDTMGSQNNDSFRFGRDPGIEYGPLDFHVRNRFTGSVIYQLPFGQGARFGGSSNAVVDKLIGPWTASGIVTLSSGNWFTVIDGNGDFANSDGQQRPDFVPGRARDGSHVFQEHSSI